MRRSLSVALAARSSTAQRAGRMSQVLSQRSVWRSAVFGMIGCVVLLAFASSAFAAGTGKIEGTVTNASHTAMVGASVTVYDAGEEFQGAATTNAKGEYTVSGLSEGSYEVEFKDPSYATQYYNKEATLSHATPVSVSEGVTTLNIDAEMLEPGRIAGRVTNSGGTPLAGVAVDVYPVNTSFPVVKSAFTNANGEYTVEGLAEGEYRVRFTSNEGEYLTQYYSGQSSFTSANPILVTAGKTVPSIDATLLEGGKITGTVTDAYSHVGLGKIDVFASASGGEFGFGFAKTDSSGAYTIRGLPTGSYKLEFSWEYSEAEEKACEHAPRCPPKYITQYYSNQPSSVTANPVTATVGAVTAGINAAMVPSAPFNTVGPSISGKPLVGSLLTCSSGSWTGEPELALAVGWPLVGTFSYQWLRDGTAIAGANSDAYIVQAADLGHSLVCEVTAANVAGHTSARSSGLAIVKPVPVVKTSTTKLKVAKNAAKLSLSCANAPCVGSAEVFERSAIRRHKGKARKLTVVLAKGSYSLAASQTGIVSLRLTFAGRTRLARRRRLSEKLAVSVTGGKPIQKRVQIGL
jgi:hypothetical protein